MFDFIRRHTKLIMGVLFLLIIPSFVLFGLEGYTRFNDGGTKVATVDGKPITQTEWDNAHRMEVDRLRATNPSLDLSLLDSPALKRASLERLVQERVLAAAQATDQQARSELIRALDAAGFVTLPLYGALVIVVVAESVPVRVASVTSRRIALPISASTSV